MAELDKVDLDAGTNEADDGGVDEFYEEQKRHQERVKEHQQSLSHAYGTNNLSERIGKTGVILIFGLFSLNIFFFILLLMSFFPAAKGLFGSILSFINI